MIKDHGVPNSNYRAKAAWKAATSQKQAPPVFIHASTQHSPQPVGLQHALVCSRPSAWSFFDVCDASLMFQAFSLLPFHQANGFHIFDFPDLSRILNSSEKRQLITRIYRIARPAFAGKNSFNSIH